MEEKNGYGYVYPKGYDKNNIISYILSVTPARVPQSSYVRVNMRVNDSANADNRVFVCDNCGDAWRWSSDTNRNKYPEYCSNIPKYGKKHKPCPICTGEFKVKLIGD